MNTTTSQTAAMAPSQPQQSAANSGPAPSLTASHLPADESLVTTTDCSGYTRCSATTVNNSDGAKQIFKNKFLTQVTCNTNT